MAQKKAARRAGKAAPASATGNKSFSYRKHQIDIQETEKSCRVVVDGEPLHIEKIEPGRYHSHVIMFRDYDSLDELVKDVIDKEGELWFSAERRKQMRGPSSQQQQ
jgi:hypothetical protein